MKKRKKPLELDLSVLDDLANGDAGELAGLIAMFNRHMTDGIDAVRTAIASRQYVRAAQVTHTCIGFTGALGITALVATLRKLEEACKKGAPRSMARCLARWQHEFEQVREALEAWVRRSP